MKINCIRKDYIQYIPKTDEFSFPSLKCPFCKIRTPLIQNISIDKKTNLPFLSLKCICFPNGEPKSIYLDKYISFLKEKPICFKHKDKIAIIFCEKCEFKMCELCNSFHNIFENKNGHIIKQLNATAPNNNNMINNDNMNEDIFEYWTKTHIDLKIKTIENISQLQDKIINEYNNYISTEIKIIDDMISKLNTVKKEIEIKKNIIIKNTENIFDFAKILYNNFYNKDGTCNNNINIENICNIAKINFNENFILKYDNHFIQKICKGFNKVLTVLHNQQFEMVNRTCINFDKAEISNFTTGRPTKTRDETNDKKNTQTTKVITSEIDNKIEYNDIVIEDKDKTEEKIEHNILNSSVINDNNNYNITEETKVNANCNNIYPYFMENYSSEYENGRQLEKNKNTEIYIEENDEDKLTSKENDNNSILDEVFQNDFKYNNKNNSIDKKNINSNNSDNTVKRNISKKKDIRHITCNNVIAGHRGAISSMIQLNHNPNSAINGELVTVGNDNSVLFWNPNNFQPIGKIESKISNINYINELLDGTLVVCHEDNTIKLYTIPSQICTSILIGHSNIISGIIQFNIKNIISSSYDKTIKIWNIERGECIKTLNHHLDSVTSIIAIGDDSFASGSADSTIVIWKQYKVTEILKGHIGEVSVLFKVNDTTILSGGTDNILKVWDISIGVCMGNLNKHKAPITFISNFKYNNNNIVFSVSQDRSIIIWNIEKRKCINRILNAHAKGITCGTCLSNGNFATGGEDRVIKIWG